ncbi:GNAT family N-acetyltransferase [Lapillicoccus jejuensis]|uniref:Ribosomal protein S18 acetylase RimI-like enzyme n=1 Tax=Lapillicoccus jejuensis TaxID=402171 RepID=A0A542E2U5_9MICO|nr:GNAT family N-acetyltransferase [Lapillicoccus jejuensis]TQJ09655.1 ribosomal protein S18 acetylase RimI-like enzyme [Lapillicoccus jejuensis]
MRITPLDLADDVACRRAYDAGVSAIVLDRPWISPASLAEALVDWRHPEPGIRQEMVVALGDGDDGLPLDAVAGTATLWLSDDDNTDKAWVEVRVHADHRRRGVGRALVEHLVARARAEGRVEVLADLAVPVTDRADLVGHPYVAFAQALGFEQVAVDVNRHLELPVADEALDALEERARPRWEGRYSLQTHVDGVPEELRQGLCDAMNRLATDAPSGDVDFEPESLTPAKYAHNLKVLREQGRHRLTTIAVEDATGVVAAYTDLVLPAEPNPVVWQWGTLVVAEHRGHALGTAVKVANLRRLQADHPARERVVTGNNDTNRWMIDVNEAMGFRVRELCPEVRRRLEPAGA